MREFDDVVADGIWSFLGPQQVGSNLAKDFFLEVTSRPWADGTVDEPSRAMAAGKVAVEAVIARCTSAVKTVTTVQAQIGTGPWRGFDSLSTSPMLDPKLLTPAL